MCVCARVCGCVCGFRANVSLICDINAINYSTSVKNIPVGFFSPYTPVLIRRLVEAIMSAVFVPHNNICRCTVSSFCLFSSHSGVCFFSHRVCHIFHSSTAIFDRVSDHFYQDSVINMWSIGLVRYRFKWTDANFYCVLQIISMYR